MRTTPVLGLPALDSTDKARDIPEQSWTLAQQLEAILLQNGQPPVSSDLVSLVQRIVALEAKPAGQVFHDESAFRDKAIPAGAQMINKRGFGTAKRDAAGRYQLTFKTPFPNGIAGIVALSLEGIGSQPVVNSGLLDVRGANLIWVNAGAGTNTFSWWAWGW